MENIDKLFKNKLLNHQVESSDQAWNKLEEALYGKQIRHRSLVAYWQIAAAVALLLAASFFYFQTNHEEKQLADKQLKKIEETAKQQENKTNQPIENQKELAKVEEKAKMLYDNTQKANLESITMKKENLTSSKLISFAKEKVHVKEEKRIEHANSEEVILKEETIISVLSKPQEQTLIANEPKQADEKLGFTITVKIEDEPVNGQEIEEKKNKKSWVGKMFANMRKSRDKERDKHEKGEDEERPEKSNISVFGISADKIFAKKEHHSTEEKHTNE